MAQPDYVPLVSSDRVRPSSRLSVPGRWEQDRPAELGSLRPPSGRGLGATGTDLGYGLKLAARVLERAVLAPGEHADDALAGCFATGCRRSSFFHRAPVMGDMEWAFTLWGFMPGAPDALVAYRRPVFSGVSHDYARQRTLVDFVAQDAVKLDALKIYAGLSANWRQWTGGQATSQT